MSHLTKKHTVATTALLTILRYETTRVLRIWTQTLLPSAVTTLLYFVIFGELIGQRVGAFDGVPYIDFIAPGLIMMAVITNAYANVSSSFFSSRFARYIEELLTAPVPSLVILIGYTAGGVVRALIVGGVVGVIAFIFADLTIAHGVLLCFSVLLTALVFSLAGFFNGVFAKRFDDVSFVPTFVLTPLTYLGGVFYSITLLSPFWQKLSMLNPILYIVNTFRYSLLNISDVSIWLSFGFLSILSIVLFLLNLYLLERSPRIRE